MISKAYTTTAIIAIASILAIAPIMAAAQNPHYVREPTLTLSGNTARSSAFSIAGLGSDATVTATLVVKGTCDVQCKNKGGNIAPGQDTEAVGSTTIGPIQCDKGAIWVTKIAYAYSGKCGTNNIS